MAIEYRTLDYGNLEEVRRYLELFYAIPADLDAYYFAKSPEFIAACVETARREETPANTFAGIALGRDAIVGLHIVRLFEEGPRIGAHIAGLWVAELHRRTGVARTLKRAGEAWARSIGASFLHSNVLSTNTRMLELNVRIGFQPYRVQLRKRL